MRRTRVAADAHGQRRAVDGDEIAAASGIDAGRRGGGLADRKSDLGDGRREVDGLAAVPIGSGTGVVAVDGDADVVASQRVRERQRDMRGRSERQRRQRRYRQLYRIVVADVERERARLRVVLVGDHVEFEGVEGEGRGEFGFPRLPRDARERR